MSISTPIEQLIDRFQEDQRRRQSSYNETDMTRLRPNPAEPKDSCPPTPAW